MDPALELAPHRNVQLVWLHSRHCDADHRAGRQLGTGRLVTVLLRTVSIGGSSIALPGGGGGAAAAGLGACRRFAGGGGGCSSGGGIAGGAQEGDVG